MLRARLLSTPGDVDNWALHEIDWGPYDDLFNTKKALNRRTSGLTEKEGILPKEEGRVVYVIERIDP